MSRPSRIAKRLVLPALLAAGLIVAVPGVIAVPTADFSSVISNESPASDCKELTFSGTASDTDVPETTFETFEWDYGSGFEANATHTFAAGTHSVTVRATDAENPAVTATATKSVSVTSASAPTGTITGPATAQAGQPVNYTVTGNDADGTIAGYAWDFDGNGFDNGTGTGPTPHTFPASAVGTTQTVRVQMTDNCNVQGIATLPVTVTAAQAPPVPSFTMKVNGVDVDTVNPGDQVDFASTSTDPNGDPMTFSWALDPDGAFNDGTTATIDNKIYPIFTTPRTIRIKLQVSDGKAGSPVETFLDLHVNKAPFAAFSVNPVVPLINEAVTFDAGASFDFEPDSDIASYEWDFDYGGIEAGFTPDDTGALVGHTFTTPGMKPMALRVSDADGGKTVLPRTVEVVPTRPNAGLTYSPQDPLPGQAVTLTSTSTPSTSPGAPALETTQWDLDYSPATDFTLDAAGGSIVTSFATPGPHTVAVKVTETGGGVAIKEATIVVNAPPQASFTVAPAKPVEGREVTFASTSGDPDGPLAKQEWDLDNNGAYERAGAVVSTSSLKKGTRPVRLRVTDAKGATAVTTQTINVTTKPLKPPLNINSSVRYRPEKWGIMLKAFTVSVQSRTKVSVSCKGPGCPRGTFRKSSKTKRALLSFSKVKGNLRAGAKISIIFTRPGHMTGWDTITVRGGVRRTVLREGCKPSGAKKPKRCPGA